MNWMLLFGKKQTRKPFGFIQQSEQASAVAGFTQDIAGPATTSFHWWAETGPEGGEGCRYLTPGLAWYSLTQDIPLQPFTLWRKGVMAPTGTSHPRASQCSYWPWSCFPLPPLSQVQPPFRSHMWEFSASVWDPLGFFTSVSVCLSSQVLDKGTNYCGAPHHCT